MWLFEVTLLPFSIEDTLLDSLDGMVVNFNIAAWLGSGHLFFINPMASIKVIGDDTHYKQ